MEDKVIYISKTGLENLRKEVDRLTSIERPAISAQIAEARDKGDLSENAEYDAAKEAQGMLEMKIAKLQNTIRNARVIDESKLDSERVQMLNRVKIKNLKSNKVIEYMIVSESEADLKIGKISIGTPIAKGLIGKKVGDIAYIEAPAGKLEFEILEISL